MAKDYKHSKRRTGGGSGLSGMAGFVCGLALGLAVALGVYLFDRRTEARLAAQQTAPMTRDETHTQAKPAPASQEEETQQFDFYEMLPKYEVVIPEQDSRSGSAPAVVAGPGPVQKPGAYILQAGSFRNNKDADRVRAMIAMQGVESKIQKVTIDKDTWHRVRVGPITNLQKLEDTRSKLRQAQIDALVIRVGE
ncbi:SPOR domain-containing protein [Steroidobacter sp.]|uniref:SPOR domain-containing protein n=1 Tax=Steroidobacter sp. TaxID=1978227 RepID=UPI001A3FAA7A|nr:SPOR domain-containing protein [Steroidobacter sp.]MBL8269367.1 SPOR domain-containing protein [Steroidobacter sp.]